ncbi:MAG: tRNA (adenosine(37)-N6)-threonylcarbamoyltransferase complex ATPase subunit type 1 TsaE [Candidatus Paceibacterota bacterium]|jgi:tRNA threonylcarbamoyladenosine biosynthesis protein TsaE
MKTVISKSPAETVLLAEEFLNSKLNHIGKHATIVPLYGDLGSGKTAFVQALAKKLGVNETVSSPTFVIQKTYNTIHPIFQKLIHIDAYRLKEGAELIHLRWEDISKDSKNLIVIEWPQRVEDILPKGTTPVHFKFVSENEREIQF